MRFTKDILTEFSFEEKLEHGLTGHYALKDSGNRKQRPKARERQTEARGYRRERDRCG